MIGHIYINQLNFLNYSYGFLLPSTGPFMTVNYMVKNASPSFHHFVYFALTATAAPPNIVNQWSYPWQQFSELGLLGNICKRGCPNCVVGV